MKKRIKQLYLELLAKLKKSIAKLELGDNNFNRNNKNNGQNGKQ